MKRLRLRKQQAGATLIEALVAIIVFALGMLGQVAFMLTAMQNNQQSRYRAVASYYAEEMASMAIADIANRSKYKVGSNSTCTDTAFAPCTSWLTRLKGDLPQATGTAVSVDYDDTATSATFGRMKITVQWKAADGSTPQQLVSTTNLNLINQ
ncbi:MAG: prepilin-type N-terminal cleavage/methylation domain-containing protein [Candidatus Dactylopiibacterium sp.]|nr:prepilin-type N-terminal cleavage/methylation domain-containing protein [Candidatus Dactylopiibacterium sp.]